MSPEQRERARKHLTSDIRFAERSAQWYQDLPSHEGDRTSAMMAERYAVTADALRAVLAMLAEPVGYAVVSHEGDPLNITIWRTTVWPDRVEEYVRMHPGSFPVSLHLVGEP